MVECVYPKPYRSLSSQIPTWTINPQTSCCLYTLFPPEIRFLIFKFAFTEEDVYHSRNGKRLFDFPEPRWQIRNLHDDASKPENLDEDLEGFDMQYYKRHLDDVSHRRQRDWLRPGSTGRRRQYTALLRTCRQIFVEARDLLTAQTTIVSIDAAGGKRLSSDEQLSKYVMARYTANRIKFLHQFAHLAYLEDALWIDCKQFGVYRCVQNLRLTIRKTDWWHWQKSMPLDLLPYDDGGNAETYTETERQSLSMKDQMEMTKEYGKSITRPPIPPIPFFRNFEERDDISWGDSLSWFPNLKTLTMDFEYSEDKFYDLHDLAHWAQRVWTFRLGGTMKGYYLSAEGSPVKKSSWRGLATHWSKECPCQSVVTSYETDLSDSEEDYDWHTPGECCARREELKALGIGPKMYVFTVRWTARKLAPEYGDDPYVPGPGELPDRFPEDMDDGKDIDPSVDRNIMSMTNEEKAARGIFQ
ncbi:Fc.00g087160.m01.CDS01 [Cosmosporella sp. VM-42]